MKPENPLQNITPEIQPVKYGESVEINDVSDSKESGLDEGAERFERTSELSAIASDVGLSTSLPAPVVNTNTDVDDTTITNTPMVANDDDLIEKEWVDRAKRIVSETQNDPHKRGNEVSKLQAEYIDKRYGRKLGAA